MYIVTAADHHSIATASQSKGILLTSHLLNWLQTELDE